MELLYSIFVALLSVTTTLGSEVCRTYPSHDMQCVCDDLTELKEMPAVYDDAVTSFTFINCQFLELHNIPYKNAESLHIINSNVMSIASGAFKNLTRLTFLNLNDNVLTDITKDKLVGLEDLQTLKLSGNRLGKLSRDVFSNLKRLKYIDLSNNNGLQLQSGSFAQNSRLKTVKMQKCNLDKVPTAVTKLAELRVLSLSGNSFRSLPENAFPGLPALQTLELNNCALQDISPSTFDGHPQLSFLNLGYNRIDHLEERHFKDFHDALETLWLNDNLFQTLPKDLLNWEQVTEVKLGNNPWQCDCKIHWIYSLQHRHNDKENVTCRTPRIHTGHNLYNMTIQMSCGIEVPHKAKVALAVTLPIIVLCVLLTAFFLYRIIKNRRKGQHKSFRYSAVYKDTVEQPARTPVI